MPAEQNTNRAMVLNGPDAFKMAQAIYNAVTEKTERLTRMYGNNCRIEFNDLKQLHAKLEQMSAQWQVLSRNCSIVVQYLDDNKEQFSSFERFSIYDASKTSATESVVIEYNLLIAIPGVEKPQPYKISVRALSRVAAMAKMENEMAPPPFFRLFSNYTLIVEIDYVDYSVARNMLSTFDSWVDEVELTEKPMVSDFVQSRSHHLPSFFRLIIIIFTAIGFYYSVPAVLTLKSTFIEVTQYIVLAFSGIFFFSHLAVMLGSWIETSVDNIFTLSYIHLNKGDERLVKGFEKKNRYNCVKILAGFAMLLIEAVTVSYFSERLIKLLM
ncbi:MAG: hypothetical protein K0Q55_2250 [Verrucomicrobia bacterium]|jgi:hypothetical protein|nr:hypothetical protein [Verrucomicrobiota bacterium]